MATTVTCLCGARLKLHEKDAGRCGKCPKCGRALTVEFRGSPESDRPPSCWRHTPKPGEMFAGPPGTVWVNSTNKPLYQFVPGFKACCGVCLQNAHKIGSSWGIPLHEGCVCKQRLLKPGETSLPFLDLSELLRALTPAQQDAVMGRNNWLLFRAALVDWEAVVTSGRVREFHEVMDREGLDVEDMVKAGVLDTEARAAWDLVHTPERAAMDERRARIYQAMLDKGMTPEQIKKAVSIKIGGRVVPKRPPKRKGS